MAGIKQKLVATHAEMLLIVSEWVSDPRTVSICVERENANSVANNRSWCIERLTDIPERRVKERRVT